MRGQAWTNPAKELEEKAAEYDEDGESPVCSTKEQRWPTIHCSKEPNRAEGHTVEKHFYLIRRNTDGRAAR